MAFKETVVHGRIAREHLVQLFDTGESLAATVSEFLLDGFHQGQTLLLVCTKPNWIGIAHKLNDSGVRVNVAQQSGQLIVRDAAQTLELFMKQGRPQPRLFDASVGALIRQLASRGKGLRVFGEMVDLLAAAGDYRTAQEIEELWNGLAEREPFTLFCGYSAASFGDPLTTDALRAICRAHSHVRSDPRDVLGTFLSSTQSA